MRFFIGLPFPGIGFWVQKDACFLLDSPVIFPLC